MSKIFNSQELIDRYVQAVRFWLPASQQPDIPAELSEDLRSQIDEKESEIGRPLSENEVMAILKRCGPPMVVASRYRPQTSLIGPVLFPIYLFVLKLVLLWVLTPLFLVIIGPAMILPASNRFSALLSTFGTFGTALFMSAAVITMVFAILERSQAALKLTEWNKHSLPPLPKNPQPSKTQSVFELVFAVGGFLYLLAIPHYDFLVLGPAAAFLKINPAFMATFYWPVLFLSMLGMAQRILLLVRPMWSWYPAASHLFGTAIGLTVIHYILNFAVQPPGDWHPYVVLVDAASASLQVKKTEAIVNVSILLSMAGTWLGLCIAFVIQTWELLRQIRKGVPQAGDPALLRML